MRETRAIDAADARLEVRETDTGPPRLIGYAAVFDRPADIAGLFAEVVCPTAFRKTLADGADVRCLWQHDPSVVLGRTRSGTLRLETDEIGLRYEVDLPDTTAARDVWELVRRGDVTQSSFAFEAIKDDWTSDEGRSVRYLREVRLLDVSPVTYPAYEETIVQARSLWEHRAVAAALLPIGEDGQGWDADEALDRVREWAGGEDWDPARFRRAFLWWDSSAPEKLGSYKLPIGDIRGGDLVAVPEALRAAASRLPQTDIPDQDKARVRAILDRYFARLDESEAKSTRSDATEQPEAEPSPTLSATEQPTRERLYLRRLQLQVVMSDLTRRLSHVRDPDAHRASHQGAR